MNDFLNISAAQIDAEIEALGSALAGVSETATGGAVTAIIGRRLGALVHLRNERGEDWAHARFCSWGDALAAFSRARQAEFTATCPDAPDWLVAVLADYLEGAGGTDVEDWLKQQGLRPCDRTFLVG